MKVGWNIDSGAEAYSQLYDLFVFSCSNQWLGYPKNPAALAIIGPCFKMTGSLYQPYIPTPFQS